MPAEKPPQPASPAEYYARELIQQVAQLTAAVHGLTKAVLLNAQATIAAPSGRHAEAGMNDLGGLAKNIGSLLRGLR